MEDFNYKIVSLMMNELDDIQIHKLKNVLNVISNDYQITKKETSIEVYSGNEIDYVVKKFILTKKVEGCSDNTLKYYSRELNNSLRKINKPIKNINSDDILVYLANRDLKDKVSKTTQDNELRCLRTLFAHLLAEDYITKNPCLKLKAIKSRKKKKKSFTELEVEKMRNACKNSKEKAILEILLSTGCRASEIASIKKTDIEDNQITILGKGNKERIVYLNVKSQIAILNYLSERNDYNPYLFPKMLSIEETKHIRSSMKYDYTNNFFVNDTEQCSRDAINSYVKKIAKRANVENVHTHKFRRTSATYALKRGMPIMQVSKMLGHESISTTQIYLDIDESELEQSHKKYVV